jgi:hypothetical protein
MHLTMDLIPLQWSVASPPDHSCPYDHVIAEAPLGVYSIEWKGWKDHDSKTVYLSGEYIGNALSLCEAKEMATTHFRQIVFACLAK